MCIRDRYYIYLMRQFVKGLPDSVIEAARIDGANEFVILYRVVYPMCKPVLTTIMVLVFIGGWNDLNGPLLYLQDSAKYTPVSYTHLAVYKRQVSDELYARGIRVVSSARILSYGVSETALGLTICACKNVFAFNEEIRNGGWVEDYSVITELFDITVGVVGCGFACLLYTSSTSSRCCTWMTRVI